MSALEIVLGAHVAGSVFGALLDLTAPGKSTSNTQATAGFIAGWLFLFIAWAATALRNAP